MKRSPKPLAFLGPALLWYVSFFIGPLLILFTYSLCQRGLYGGIDWTLTLENYQRVFDPLYLKIMGNSFILATQTTLICFGFGVPLAFVMVTRKNQVSTIWLLFAIILPLLSNFLVRTYATKELLSSHGAISQLMQAFGWPGLDAGFNASYWSVTFGMLTNYLPLMVLPLYVGFSNFDFQLLEAAKDLGAKNLECFYKIFLPNVKTALVSGATMVFVPCLGEFVIPDILGGARVQTLGKITAEQFLKTRDWPFGAAISVVMIAILVVSLLLWRKERGSE